MNETVERGLHGPAFAATLLTAALGAALLLAAAPAHAQVELVVRLEDGASGPVAQALRAGPGGGRAQAQALATRDTALAALMQQVQQARPVFGGASAASSGSSSGNASVRARAERSQPIPAFTLQFPDSAALQRAKTRLSGRPGVAYTQTTHTYSIQHSAARESNAPRPHAPTLPRPTDPLLDSLRYFPVVRVPEAHEVTTGDEDVLVGVVDTGIFFEHPDLQGQVWINPGEDLNGNGVADASDFNGVDDDGNGFVDDLRGYDFVDRPGVLYTGDYTDPDPDPSHDRLDPASALGNPHGTNVAGVIAAVRGNAEGIAGVAPGVKVLPLRAFGGDGDGTDDDIAAAIVYAADQGVDVLNFSFGDVYYSRLMEEAVQYAAARGVVMVASAGNNAAGQLQEEHYPSDFPEVISTAQLAVQVDLEGGLTLSIPGRYGTGLDLSAPGTGIFTTTLPRALTGPDRTEPEPADYYERASGSSFAAPQVAATAALLRSIDPELSAESIRSIVTASAEDLEEDGWDQRTGAGLLDVGSAVRRALPARTEITRPESDGGLRAGEVAVTGSALDPSFRSFSVYYAEGDTIAFNEDDLDFTRIAGPVEKQVYRDTLAVWDVGALKEGLYTLRLATRLQDGSTVEERRRVHVDRSAPQVELRLVDGGLIGDEVGVMVDVQTDDLARATMRVETAGGGAHVVESGRRARRHGLSWSAPGAGGKAVQVRVRVTNVAGLTATKERTVALPPNRLNTALFDEQRLDVPAGFLMPEATDYDRDGLSEIVLTEYARAAAFTDTLRTYEWDGSGFQAASTLLTNVLPRDAGDSNENGRRELLLQRSGASVLIEQRERTAYPEFSQLVYADTTAGDSDSTRINGALLTNLDARFDTDREGGEVLGYNGDTWYVSEARAGGAYPVVATLENPTTDSTDTEYQARFENGLSAERVAAGDFDGDGRRGFVMSDNGGDVVVFEAQGNDRYEAVFSRRSRRYAGAGNRLTAGDFDGDGADEWVTYTRPFAGVNSDVEREPLFGRYTLWDQAEGRNAYRVADRITVKDVDPRGAGTVAPGATVAADFDDDGRDELAVADAPALYVFRYDEGALAPVFHRPATDPPSADGPRSNGLRTQALVAEDFDGDGAPELISSAADGHLRRFVYQRAAAAAAPPRWVRAVAPGENQVRLRWRAPRADSVVVFRGASGGDLDRYATVAGDSSLADTAAAPRRYALRAHYAMDGASPLSEARAVRPEAAPAVAEVTYPAPQIARLRFTRRLSADVRTEQFTFAAAGAEQAPVGHAFSEGRRALTLRFEGVAGAQGTLRWANLSTADGLAVPPAPVALAFPEAEGGALIVEDWDIRGEQRVALAFSAPLDPSAARDASNYAVEAETPAGMEPGAVAGVAYDPEAPRRVVVTVENLRIGPTGRENALRVEAMRGRGGQTLAPEGHTIRLSEAAADLGSVYVYPNPYHAGRHAERRVTVAGLPAEASVQVLSVQGTLVQELDERGADGGLDWDLTDQGGETVPAGVYLIRVNAPEREPVLKKAAVIR